MIVSIKGHVEMTGQASELITDLVVIVRSLREALDNSIGKEASRAMIESAVKRGMEE